MHGQRTHQPPPRKQRSGLLAISGLLACLAVAFGAFGAHIAAEWLSPAMLEAFETGVDYHFFHALGLGLVGLSLERSPSSRPLLWSARLMTAGIVFFSGSLYLLSLSGQTWLGAITPVGGTAWLAAWALFAFGHWKTAGA